MSHQISWKKLDFDISNIFFILFKPKILIFASTQQPNVPGYCANYFSENISISAYHLNFFLPIEYNLELFLSRPRSKNRFHFEKYLNGIHSYNNSQPFL